ncbi:hypothetical protein C8R44DRAFT_886264 [Mycena epipterygia]|nr:hypothetical protein C8R44DRAFT_886264 [Mycena epipterygia]
MPRLDVVQGSPISKLVDDVLADIFVLCLPSYVQAETRFQSSSFVCPSAAEAPLLLCQVSFQWRSIAVTTPLLWTALNTETILRPQLLELWFHRAAECTLSLRIGKPVARFPEYYSRILPSDLLDPQDYRFPMHLHLPLILPKLLQCHELEIADWYSPHFFRPESVSPLALESISVNLSYGNRHAGRWFSQFLSQAPRLSRLHWKGPSISAPWAQLTHLSWEPRGADEFERVLSQLSALTHFRIDLLYTSDFRSPRAVHVLPRVTTFFFSGRGFALDYFTLPQLRRLILESEPVREHAEHIKCLLDRSCGAINFLEIDDHGYNHYDPPLLLEGILSLLSHTSIVSSLVHLVITSHDLNALFLALNKCSPGTLPPTLLLLRGVDRCFRIDVFPSSPPGVLPDMV